MRAPVCFEVQERVGGFELFIHLDDDTFDRVMDHSDADS